MVIVPGAVVVLTTTRRFLQFVCESGGPFLPGEMPFIGEFDG
jgi:hypothetical protein